MTKPSYRDATLMLQLAQMHSTLGVQDAMNWLWSDQFATDYTEFSRKYPRGSEEQLMVSKIVGYFETLGTLYKHGLFNEDLLFDWLAVSMVWDRIKGYALGVRQAVGNPGMYENFEAMANANVAHAAKPTRRVAKRRKK